jgi:hypothetical protein
MQNIFNDTFTYKEKLFTIILLSNINIQPPNQISTNAITQRRGQVLAGPFSDVTCAAFNSETISSLFSYYISAAINISSISLSSIFLIPQILCLGLRLRSKSRLVLINLSVEQFVGHILKRHHNKRRL